MTPGVDRIETIRETIPRIIEAGCGRRFLEFDGKNGQASHDRNHHEYGTRRIPEIDANLRHGPVGE